MVWYGILYCPNGKFVLGSQIQPLHQTIKTKTIHKEQRNTHLKLSSWPHITVLESTCQ